MTFVIFYVPKTGGQRTKFVMDETSWRMAREKSQKLAGEDMIYYEMADQVVRNYKEFVYPYVIPLSGDVREWMLYGGNQHINSYYPLKFIKDWAKDTIGGKIFATANNEAKAFYRFESMAHLLMFKMRWQDYL
jgi:hypothetical protein